ncbi:hypothetical protein AM587_10001151 [Phytophthora nicotianae]|uniref:Uncharacterized protein n=1 Tax=Phytophthora nicotianae TaxID=4792 RepID=A0A0W8DXQ7_PHYNI|nr:hypothetical protein AM587_10001151 [Phytophthora nicotianae]
MMVYLYTNSCSESDYQDAALLCLLWYLFGRASDLSMIKKRNISIDAADVFFLRLVRVKTSEEQGLSLFPDADFSTCPLLAVALALSVQAAPSPALIDNLPDQVLQTPTSLSPDVPLVELLNAPPSTSGLSTPVPPPPRAGTAPTIYAHVNRVLDRVCPAAGVSAALTSHSFRRGGAQHANGCEKMTARWIFDRGSWNLSTTNKGFNYIFNTSREDHMIAKVLSGYKPSAAVHLQDLSSFDADTLDSIARFQRVLFAACYQLETEAFNINRKVLDVLTACLVRHYPVLKDLNPKSPAVNRLETCVAHAGRTLADLLAWSAHLAKARNPCKESEEPATPPRKHESNSTEPSQEQKIIEHQAAVIKHLIENSKRQDARMDMLEAKINGDPVAATHKRNRQDEDTADVSEPKKKQRRGSVTHLHATWFTWYAQEPRWYAGEPKQQRSKAKLLVAFMKLFLEDGFVLDEKSADYRDRVLEHGKRAEDAVLAYLKKEHGINSRGSSAVLKHLQGIHSAGSLNAMIQRHRRLLQTPAIQDPAPGYTQDVLEEVSK